MTSGSSGISDDSLDLSTKFIQADVTSTPEAPSTTISKSTITLSTGKFEDGSTNFVRNDFPISTQQQDAYYTLTTHSTPTSQGRRKINTAFPTISLTRIVRSTAADDVTGDYAADDTSTVNDTRYQTTKDSQEETATSTSIGANGTFGMNYNNTSTRSTPAYTICSPRSLSVCYEKIVKRADVALEYAIQMKKCLASLRFSQQIMNVTVRSTVLPPEPGEVNTTLLNHLNVSVEQQTIVAALQIYDAHLTILKDTRCAAISFNMLLTELRRLIRNVEMSMAASGDAALPVSDARTPLDAYVGMVNPSRRDMRDYLTVKRYIGWLLYTKQVYESLVIGTYV
ncbi:PREDICTED: uncharacterized protein LOC106809122 [Priapulus caudatus]|uniref:Uncharacterized protein LOC106809122 n=1 Tax=Priapulus caudatus TaxID=37621 RepID=A0ABM1E5U9_PRICU|nr:PREDICTED: uncharacterized protein LOC106809122 [Priapulus caudatus]